MFVRELATRLPIPTPVAVSAINPGFCHSRLTREFERNLIINIVLCAMKALVARTTEVGSRTLVHPAVEPGERERHGRYLSACEVAEESDHILSEEGKEISRRLWVSASSALRFCAERVRLTRILSLARRRRQFRFWERSIQG